MEKITKEEFYRIATSEGLYLLGASGITLEETKTLLDKNMCLDIKQFTKTVCTRKGNKIYRNASSLTLDSDDTVYKYGPFIVVHTFTPKGKGCSFDSYNTIIYI